MYNKIKIFIVIAIASFALMIALSVTGEMIPFRYATAVIVTIFSLFFIFGLSMVPIMIKAVLRGNISLWNKYPLSGRGFSERMRQRIIENEQGIFYALLISFWAVYILGLAIALPFMIKDGFFEPQIPQPGASIFAPISTPLYAATKDEITVEQEYHETIYSLKDIPIKLSVYHGGNEGVIHFESGSDQPVDWQIDIMDRLLSRALKDQKGPIDTLFMGTVEESFGKNKEVLNRLVLAAKESALWNAKKGKAKDGNDNKTVKTLLNDNNVYRELADMFKRHQMIIKVRSVEKVRINENKLPFDCMIWFSVEKTGE
jgi:hypothetical protein